MEFLNALGISSTSGYIGITLLAIGGFLILAGVGVISIQQVTVKQGRATWVLGLLMAGVGVILLYPEVSSPDAVSDAPAAVVETQPATTLSSSDENGSLSEWKTIKFAVPGNGLWREETGSYTAVGSKDTIAWSEDMLAGDLELSLDIESSSPFSAANIVIYGNGGSLATGNLIFTVASDLQAILADSIYDDGTYLFSSLSSVGFGGQKHSVLISIIDRKAILFLDGDQIASVLLDESINTNGRIGLLKYWEIDDVTFSNIRIRESESLN